MSQEPDQLVQVVFRSQPMAPLDDSRLRSLAEECDDLHRSLGLSGLLIMFERTFVGVVEGPRAVALERLEALVAHRVFAGLTVLREADIARRRFGTWRFQDMRTLDGDAALQVMGGLFAQRLSQELCKSS